MQCTPIEHLTSGDLPMPLRQCRERLITSALAVPNAACGLPHPPRRRHLQNPKSKFVNQLNMVKNSEAIFVRWSRSGAEAQVVRLRTDTYRRNAPASVSTSFFAIEPSVSSFGLKIVTSRPTALPEATATRSIVANSSHDSPPGMR